MSWRGLVWLLAVALSLGYCQTVRAQEAPAVETPAEGAESEEAAPGALSPPATGNAADEEAYFELMRIFADTFEQVEKNYVKEIDRRRLIEAALKGMMRELDPFSNYISPEDLGDFRDTVEQEFGGIGIQLNTGKVDGQFRLVVSAPIPGTPAQRAGVKPGDVILEINGKTTETMTMDDAKKLMRGPPGEEVSITVRHLGSNEVAKLTMQRAIIEVPTVHGFAHNADGSWNFMIDPEKKIGYIELTAFSRHSGKEVEDAVKQLVAQGMKGLVFDLRYNPGGLLNIAIEIADLFLEEGKIVSTRGRNTEERPALARKEGTYSGFPMVVLVNRFSASASEIVSAALQDHQRAIVVGERTFGKGSVQNVIDLENGKSAIKLTTASYHRPNGKNIHRFPDSKDEDDWGVQPDDGYLVKFNNEDTAKLFEHRRERDSFRENPPKPSDYVDKQLAKGLEYISSKLAAPAAAPAAGP